MYIAFPRSLGGEVYGFPRSRGDEATRPLWLRHFPPQRGKPVSPALIRLSPASVAKRTIRFPPLAGEMSVGQRGPEAEGRGACQPNNRHAAHEQEPSSPRATHPFLPSPLCPGGHFPRQRGKARPRALFGCAVSPLNGGNP